VIADHIAVHVYSATCNVLYTNSLTYLHTPLVQVIAWCLAKFARTQRNWICVFVVQFAKTIVIVETT